MASIHQGTITLANAGVAQALSPGVRVACRQLFIQCNQNFSVGASNVTPTTGLVCSAVSAAAVATNAPHTPTLGTTSGSSLINLAEVFCVSATPGAVVTFLYIA
jgi:hypothetical protein